MVRTDRNNLLDGFVQWLRDSERSAATVKKYVREVRQFLLWLAGREATRELLMTYRDGLRTRKKAQTVNGVLSALNSWLGYRSRTDLRVKFLKVQHSAFLDDARRLGKDDYRRLLSAARNAGKERLRMVMLTLGSTGIRISELKYITVEAARAGRTQIQLKGKCRDILLPERLKRELLDYAGSRGITGGIIFRTRGGRPLDRSNVFHEMKRLSETAQVDARKVFPHSFRHFFARAFYEVDKNLARLADLLGHSHIETTRIYVAESTKTFESILNRMDLFADAGDGDFFGTKIPQNLSSVVSENRAIPQLQSF